MPINQNRLYTHPGRRRFGVGVVVTAMTALGMPLAATTASAAVVTPPAGTHVITVLPGLDQVSAAGYVNETATIQVLRGGVVIGTTVELTPDPADTTGTIDAGITGFVAGTGCWVGVTPDIRPGDLVQVLTRVGAQPDGDQTTTAAVTVTQDSRLTAAGSGIVTIKGTAAVGTVAELEVTILAPKGSAGFASGNKLVANSANSKEGPIVMDPLGNWTATFSGLSVAAANLAVQGTSTASWLGAGGTEITTSSFTDKPGPATGDCAAPLANGPAKPFMTQATNSGFSATDSISNNTRPTFTGQIGRTQTATTVNLYVDGSLTPAGTGPVTNGIYSVTPNAPLTDGTHVITVGEVGPNAAILPAIGTVETMGSASGSVTIDTLAPTMLSHSLGGRRVPGAANLTATMSEDVTGVSRATFTVRRTLSRVSAGTTDVTFNPITKIATLNPRAVLAPSTYHTVSVTSAIKDIAGNSMRAASWVFATAPRATVTLGRPTGTNVHRASNIRAGFSEKVTGVNRATFYLRNTATGRSVGATVVTFNAATRVATLNPKARLAPRTRYTVTLTNGIKDMDRNRIFTKRWTFVTGR